MSRRPALPDDADDQPPPKTKWGDREGRRRDILNAARHQMADGGYLSLSMREIAKGAGVSPGLLYSYFTRKEEIFATLYAEAIIDHNARVAPLCREATRLVPLLAGVAHEYLDLYRTYGRYFSLWSVLEDEAHHLESEPLPRELVVALREATDRQSRIFASAISRTAKAEGLKMTDRPFVFTYVWMALVGLSDHIISDRRHMSRMPVDDMIDRWARTVARGITRPA